MIRHWISRMTLWGCKDPRRAICSTQCVLQRGQWGNERPRGYSRGNSDYGGQRGGGGRRDHGDQGNQGEWGGQRGGGGRRDYGDHGNQGEWGGQRGGGGRRDYGDQGNQGEWGGQRGGGGRRDHGDQGNQGEWGGQRGGGGRRDHGDQGNQGEWGGQRGGGGRRDHGDQGNQGEWGGQRGGGGRRDYGDQGNQGEWGGQRGGGGRRDHGDQGNQGEWGGQRGGGGRRDHGDQGNQGEWGGQRGGGGRRDYGDQGNQGEWGGQRGGGGRRDYGDQGNQGEWGGQRGGGGRRDHGDQGNQGEWGGQRGGGGRRDYGDQGNQGEWGGQRGGGGRRDYGDQGNQGEWGGQRGGGGRRDYGDQGNQGEWGGQRGRHVRGGESSRGGRFQDGRGGDERPPEVPFDEQAAKNLFEMKRQYKNAKSEKDRQDIQREARRAVRRVRVDPSSQDEKAVILLLNCAATFRCFPHSEGIKQAVQWMRQNIDALSPQNLALFASAVGSLSVIDGDVILLQEVTPAVQSSFTQMSPVELVMILQAFQRSKIYSNASLQESMLRQLSSCVPTMPVPQLSTLACTLVDSPLRKSDESAWKELSNAVLSKAVSNIDKMHSREVITLLGATPHLCVPEEVSLQLVKRAMDTVGFHTDEQIGELLASVAGYRAQEKPPGEELNSKLNELVSALWKRLEKVALYADGSSAAFIMRQARRCGAELPLSVLNTMLETVRKDMCFHRYTFRRCAALVEAVAEEKIQAKALLQQIGDYCIGKRPSCEDQEGASQHDEEDPSREVRMDIYAFFLGDLTRARIALENAYSANPENGGLGENVSLTLTKRLEESVVVAPPREVLKCVRVICTSAEDCKLRNKASDEKILKLVEQRLLKERDAFTSDIPRGNIERFLNDVKDQPRAQKIVLALSTK